MFSMQVSVTGMSVHVVESCASSMQLAYINVNPVCVFRSLQDVQIWFQPNLGSSSAVFLPHSDSQDGFGKSQS